MTASGDDAIMIFECRHSAGVDVPGTASSSSRQAAANGRQGNAQRGSHGSFKHAPRLTTQAVAPSNSTATFPHQQPDSQVAMPAPTACASINSSAYKKQRLYSAQLVCSVWHGLPQP